MDETKAEEEQAGANEWDYRVVQYVKDNRVRHVIQEVYFKEGGVPEFALDCDPLETWAAASDGEDAPLEVLKDEMAARLCALVQPVIDGSLLRPVDEVVKEALDEAGVAEDEVTNEDYARGYNDGMRAQVLKDMTGV